MTELPTVVYKRPGDPGLGSYTRFMVDPLRVVFDNETMNRDDQQLMSLMTYFQEQLEGKLRKSGYSIADAPGPQTFRIAAVISNVKASGAAATTTNVAMMPVAPITPSVGGVTVEAAFIASTENRIDAVAIERSQGRRMLNSSPWSTERDVKSSFRQWAVGIRKAVDEAHGR